MTDIAVWVWPHRSGRWEVTTTPEHPLEVRIEQLTYDRTYTGTGSVATEVTPVAPIGTKGKITAVDMVTGERRERPWTWVPLHNVDSLTRLTLFERMVRAVKGMFGAQD